MRLRPRQYDRTGFDFERNDRSRFAVILRLLHPHDKGNLAHVDRRENVAVQFGIVREIVSRRRKDRVRRFGVAAHRKRHVVPVNRIRNRKTQFGKRFVDVERLRVCRESRIVVIQSIVRVRKRGRRRNVTAVCDEFPVFFAVTARIDLPARHVGNGAFVAAYETFGRNRCNRMLQLARVFEFGIRPDDRNRFRQDLEEVLRVFATLDRIVGIAKAHGDRFEIPTGVLCSENGHFKRFVARVAVLFRFDERLFRNRSLRRLFFAVVDIFGIRRPNEFDRLRQNDKLHRVAVEHVIRVAERGNRRKVRARVHRVIRVGLIAVFAEPR